jgi:ATP-dependent Lon protease
VIIPFENEKDLEEMPDVVKKSMKFILASDMDEVLAHALVEDDSHDN